MQRTTQKLINTTPKPDTEKKTNQELTTKTKPAMTLKPARKVKTTVMPRSDLKLKKKQERELKQTMKVNVVVVKPSPSTSHDSATISMIFGGRGSLEWHCIEETHSTRASIS